MLVTESWWAFSFVLVLPKTESVDNHHCEYAAICRKRYGRDRDRIGNGCLLGKVLVKGPAFLSLHVGAGDGTAFCELTMQSSLLGWRTVQSGLFRFNNVLLSGRIGIRFSFACFDVTMQSPRFGWTTVLRFLFDIIMQSSLLGRWTVPSCLFRYNNAEFSIRIENGAVLPFFDIRMHSSLLGLTIPSSLLDWEVVQSCLSRHNSAAFFVEMENSSVLSFSI